ncbi:hypothetical protein [Reyranella sp.]|uniref:hypothetical protein n=1 Tax=Reyranella sp. TaxID=1929291 RepID=UPI003D0EF300
MPDREDELRKLAVGDIFHANSPNGASLICLVLSVTEEAIQSRTVTTQVYLEFDRRTGNAEWGEDPIICTIDSITPLPVEIHNTMLGIDRKFRLERNLERLRLTDAEKRALVFVASHYPSNQL